LFGPLGEDSITKAQQQKQKVVSVSALQDFMLLVLRNILLESMEGGSNKKSNLEEFKTILITIRVIITY
jgi:hypothetical protein